MKEFQNDRKKFSRGGDRTARDNNRTSSDNNRTGFGYNKSDRGYGKPGSGRTGRDSDGSRAGRDSYRPGRDNNIPGSDSGSLGFANKPGRENYKTDRGYGRPDREGSKTDRGYGKPDREENKTDRGYGRSEREGNKTDQGYGKPDREGNKIYRGYDRPDRESNKTDRSNESLDIENYALNHDINSAGHDAAEGEDRIEGRNPVIEALKAGRSINKIFISKGDREGSITQIIAMAKEKKIVLQEVERSKLDNLSITHAHQGVIAFAAAKEYVEVDDIIEAAAAKGEPPFIIILDEINDAYNLGSILRTADAAGAHGVIIPKRRAIGLTAAVAKASAGAIEHVPVARVTNVSQTIEYLKKNNIWVAGTDSTGQKPFYDNDLRGPIALVVGSEGEGMGKLVRESCDFVVNIPMKGKVSSLNAAVAGAIVMYEIQRQRGKQST